MTSGTQPKTEIFEGAYPSPSARHLVTFMQSLILPGATT